MSKYPVGYVATIFYGGDKTKFKYRGCGEWEFVSGENSPARYKQLLDMINK